MTTHHTWHLSTQKDRDQKSTACPQRVLTAASSSAVEVTCSTALYLLQEFRKHGFLGLLKGKPKAMIAGFYGSFIVPPSTDTFANVKLFLLSARLPWDVVDILLLSSYQGNPARVNQRSSSYEEKEKVLLCFELVLVFGVVVVKVN